MPPMNTHSPPCLHLQQTVSSGKFHSYLTKPKPIPMSEINFTTEVSEVKPSTPKEIAALYHVTWKVMDRWLKPHRDAIGKREGRYYTALQVKTIFEKLGLPGKAEDNNPS